MDPIDSEPCSLLIEAVRSEDVAGVRRALERSGIPFHSGLLSGPPPRVLFYVPTTRLESARAAVSEWREPEWSEVDEDDAPDAAAPDGPHRFPWGPVQAVAALVLVHSYLVIWPVDGGLVALGGLIPERVASEPWRLLSSLFLHADLSHAMWNGLAMLVFAVPLSTRLGGGRTATIYLAAGLGGALSAVAFSSAGTVIVGSSGAVAGLFGAWVVLTLRWARSETLERRARIRTLGIAMLVLPSLLDPITSGGQPVSVSSHLGGMATGMAVGALLSMRMVPRDY